MRSERIYVNSLLELVYQNRNKDYGAYQLQKRYGKRVVIAGIVSITVILLVTLIPLYIYMVRSLNTDMNMEFIYEVEYIPFAPPENMELVELAKAHAKVPEEKTFAPIISDTVTQEEEKKPMEPDAEKMEDDPEDADTASYGTGGDDAGRQPGTDTVVATTIDVYPRYPGGVEARMYYLRRHVVYPKEAIEKGIYGTVMVVFVIEADGSITNVTISQGIGNGCDQEAMRVTKGMPKWTPGKRKGRPVRVMVKMPIVFRLPNRPAS